MDANARVQILDVLAELSEVEPNLRFGQLVANLSYLAREWTNSAIWDVEDDEFLATAREHLVARRECLASNPSTWLGTSAPSVGEIEPSVRSAV